LLSKWIGILPQEVHQIIKASASVFTFKAALGTYQQVILMTISWAMMTVKEMLTILSNYLIPLGLLYTLKNHPLFHNIKSPSWVLL